MQMVSKLVLQNWVQYTNQLTEYPPRHLNDNMPVYKTFFTNAIDVRIPFVLGIGIQPLNGTKEY